MLLSRSVWARCRMVPQQGNRSGLFRLLTFRSTRRVRVKIVIATVAVIDILCCRADSLHIQGETGKTLNGYRHCCSC